MSSDNAVPTVTVSIAPYSEFVSAIGGDSVQINILMDRDSNPESFEPGVSTMRRAADSDILFVTGTLPFEEGLVERLGDNSSSLRIVDTSEGTVKLYGTHGACKHHHKGEQPDPHVWGSVRNARIIASNIRDALVGAHPSAAEYYNHRFERYSALLDSADAAIGTRLKGLDDRKFMVWHPSLSYFANDYGLEQIALSKDGKELTPRSLADQLEKIESHGRRPLIFLQEGYDDQRARETSGQVDARVVEINPMSSKWLEQINIVANAFE